MKLINLLEVEYGVHDLLTQHMDQIKLDSGPNTYRMLQTQLTLGKDAWVENWLRSNGYVEDEDDSPPNDKGITPTFRGKAVPFHEIDALHEDEDYCPYCTTKLKEIVKKSVNKLMEKEKPGLWANIRAKRKSGKPMAKKGSKAYKTAKKAGDKINKEVDEVSINEKKGKCKPSKGKRFAKRVSGKCRSFGQKGKAKKGGDRIRPGTKKGNAYCARSAKIKKCKNPPCANALSRKKWKCQGSRSVA